MARRKYTRRSRRSFRDAVTESLIDRIEDQASAGKCKDAVRSLFRVQPIVTQPREKARFRSSIMTVERRCAHELAEELASRIEISAESGAGAQRSGLIKRGEAEKHGLRTLKRGSGEGRIEVEKEARSSGHGISSERRASPKLKRRGRRFVHLKRTRMHRGKQRDVVDLIPEE